MINTPISRQDKVHSEIKSLNHIFFFYQIRLDLSILIINTPSILYGLLVGLGNV